MTSQIKLKIIQLLGIEYLFCFICSTLNLERRKENIQMRLIRYGPRSVCQSLSQALKAPTLQNMILNLKESTPHLYNQIYHVTSFHGTHLDNSDTFYLSHDSCIRSAHFAHDSCVYPTQSQHVSSYRMYNQGGCCR